MSVTSDDAETRFIYDADGSRARKTFGAGSTYYFGDHFEYINGIPTRYVFAGNLRIAKVTPCKIHYFHKDHLGSSTVISTASGKKTDVESTAYMPYGGQRGAGGISRSSYRFTDQEFDGETGLYNYDARFYDPVVGLFVSADKIGSNFYNPQYLNRYAYCLNNPLNYNDRSGHEPNKSQATNLENVIRLIGNKTLQELRYVSGDAQGKPIGPFGGDKGDRYIYTRKRGWVDLGHFFQVSAGLQEGLNGSKKLIGKIAETYTGILSGLLWEKTIEVEEAQSGETKWSYEDAPSNILGLEYYLKYYEDDETLIDTLKDFFGDIKITDPEKAPNWEEMQDVPQKEKRFPENKSFRPMFTGPEEK